MKGGARRDATLSPMHGTRKLPNLIEEIYAAALEPALWNDRILTVRCGDELRANRKWNSVPIRLEPKRLWIS
jgi:hypothetical protein